MQPSIEDKIKHINRVHEQKAMITHEFISAGEPQTDELKAFSRSVGSGKETAEMQYTLTIMHVCDILKVTEEEIRGKARDTVYVDARHIAMYALLNMGLTLSEVGALFGRHHSTVIHARDRVCECNQQRNSKLYYKMKLTGMVK